jgi:small subunit ribosomal protein S16
VAVKLRLMRMGKKKQPTYRIVAADSRSPRNGRFIEIIGTYEPRKDPSGIELDGTKAVEWLIKGAKASDTVRKLLEHSGAWDEFRQQRPEKPKKPGRKRKATTAKKAAKKVKKAPAKAVAKKAAKKATATAPAAAPQTEAPADEAPEPTPAAPGAEAATGDATEASTDAGETPTGAEVAETTDADEVPQADEAPVEAG